MMRQHALTDGDGVTLLDGDGELLTILGDDPPSQRLIVDATFDGLTEGNFLAMLQALLPPGRLWRRDAGSNLTRLLRAISRGLVRKHQRILRMREEADPRTAYELLPEWEDLLGLPDPCTGESETLQERRAIAAARWTAKGGQSRAHYIDLAAALGVPITIEEFGQFRCDASECDVDPLNEDAWAYTWVVHAPEVTEIPFRCDESTTEEPLLTFGNAPLECTIRRAAPAHTIVHFAYGG